MFRSAG
jgi:hypothetical protein